MGNETAVLIAARDGCEHRARSVAVALQTIQSKLTISTQFEPLPVGYLLSSFSAPFA